MSWMDKSKDIYSLNYMKKLDLARLQMNKIFEYTNITWQKFNVQKASFQRRHFRDKHQEYRENKIMEGHIEFCMVLND